MSTLPNVEIPVVGELADAALATTRSESPFAQALRRLRRITRRRGTATIPTASSR